MEAEIGLMVTEAEATEIERNLLMEVVSALDSLYSYLTRVPYPDADALGQAAGLMLSLGIRQVKAATSDVAIGWLPECLSHARAAWEIGMDLAFLLSRDGAERTGLATQYVDMSRLRNPYVRLMMANPSRFEHPRVEEALKEFKSLATKYRNSNETDCARGTSLGECDAAHPR
jgi:hypothetical protein